MQHGRLRALVLRALCCALGMLAKRLISPGANLITEALHVPGGIATAFSLMFLVIGAELAPGPGCAAMMGLTQAGMALALGRVGSMGALAPIAYILPGVAIDLADLLLRRLRLSRSDSCTLRCCLASLTACLTADLLVFRLTGLPLLVYASLASLSGAVCGLLAGELTRRLAHVLLP